LFKPVFFHHAVIYTSHILTLHPAYFDQKDELAFLGNFFVYSLDAVSEIFWPLHIHTHKRTHARTLLFFLSFFVFLASECLTGKLNLFLSPAQPADRQTDSQCVTVNAQNI
jgi:hypothetical protein